MNDNNPLDNIEDEQGHRDMGKVAYLMYEGAINAGADITTAQMIIQSYFTAIATASSITSFLTGPEGE